MRVLYSICDTLIPSLPYLKGVRATTEQDAKKHQLIAPFYALSGSGDGVPEEVAKKMKKFLLPGVYDAVRMLLWLLSTRAGTLLLSGKHKPFPALLLPKREKLLHAWAVGSSSTLLRDLLQVLKCFIVREFYSKVDEDGKNPIVWKALDYAGPDPRLLSVSSDACDIVLERQIVELSKDAEVATEKLKELGLLSADCIVDREVKINVDVVIVGSGSGGAVVAAQVAKAGQKVVILEKGGYFRRTDLRLLEGPCADMYEAGGFLCTTDGGVRIFAGATLGGGSAVNWAASLRTPPHVLQEWSQEYNLGLFKSTQYMNAMDTICERLEVQDSVSEENLPNSMLREGCMSLGMHVANVPRNAPPDHFCGWCGMGCKSGKKKSANRAWLVDAARNGAVILTGCEARKITTKRQKRRAKRLQATGVIAEACLGTKKIVIKVEAKAVVVACGALWTPPLLRQSGLRNRHIGQNLHLHPVMMAWGHFKEVEPHLGKSYEGGIMTAFSQESANWNSSGYGALLMVPSLHLGAYAAMMPWVNGRAHKEMMLRFAKTVTLISLTRDFGSGCVREDGTGHLEIEYKLSKMDREHCLAAACNALRVLAAVGASRLGTHNVEGKEFDSTDETRLDEFVEEVRSSCLRNLNTPLTSAHQMGSCRMGVSPSTSAVAPSGETWEACGLFIADTSVFPSASGVNPMVTVQSIAFCTSQSILDFLRGANED
ncbi:hypothetical protein L7F22_045788 [Adiantum nelumboides]|nr:hypothetical protein [Adiantum nelumboides]